MLRMPESIQEFLFIFSPKQHLNKVQIKQAMQNKEKHNAFYQKGFPPLLSNFHITIE